MHKIYILKNKQWWWKKEREKKKKLSNGDKDYVHELEDSSQMALVVKNMLANAGDIRDAGSIPRSGRSPGGEHDNPLQYSCLENLHEEKSLAGFSSWGCKESHMIEATEQSCTHIVRMSMLPRFIHRFNTIPIKMPGGLFCRYRKDDLKIYMER